MAAMKINRVVITGIGAVTPVGLNVAESWENALAGKHGIDYIANMDTVDLKVKVAAQVKNFDPHPFMDKKDVRKTDRNVQFALAASQMAMEDCGSDLSDLDPFRVGVIIGSGMGGLSTIESEHDKLREKGPGRVSPFFIPMAIANMAAGTVSIQYGFQGANFSVVTACSSATHAIGEAYRLIKYGYLDACISGGTEASLTRFSIAGFSNMTALSTSNDPDRASIPFDKERDGFVIGEGAGVLVMESLEHALARGAHIYAEVTGYGATGDAYHITKPDPDGTGAAKAMEFAVAEAGISPGQVDYINAHGTSTPFNDYFETKAIKMMFGEHAYKLAVSSTKSVTGHLLGAAGGVEAIFCALALKQGILPPTAGYRIPDEECDLDYVTEGARKADIRVALSNSLGFGGHNASLCLQKFEG